MKSRHLAIILLTVLLSACVSPQNWEVAAQNRQSIDDALGEAAAVNIPEAESPSTEILNDLMPDTGITGYLASASDCQY